MTARISVHDHALNQQALSQQAPAVVLFESSDGIKKVSHVLSCVSVVSWRYVCLVLLSCVVICCCVSMNTRRDSSAQRVTADSPSAAGFLSNGG